MPVYPGASQTRANGLSGDQRLALDQLAELAAQGDAVQVVDQAGPPCADGSIWVEISLNCSGARHARGGIALRRRERFHILIPNDFPFSVPTVVVPHFRWANTPHVQRGKQLCLYAAPSVEWVPADGIRGLIGRLAEWLDRAALGELDPAAAPLHPPVAYAAANIGVLVIRADVGDLSPHAQPPQRSGGPTTIARSHVAETVVALCEHRGDGRFDVVEWISRHEWLHRYLTGRLIIPPGSHGLVGALAVLADDEAFFEYPDGVAALLAGLESIGLDRTDFLAALAEVAAVNYLLTPTANAGEVIDSAPLRIMVGTPSRRATTGEMRQHFVCWQVDDIGQRIAQGLIWKHSMDVTRAEIGRRVADLADRWIQVSSIRWVQVMEARPEVTVRRDSGSAESWIAGRRILILGAGALGAPIAEHCVRAGARAITIVDSGQVSPGILIRQPYRDADIYRPKATVLAERLNGLVDGPSIEAIVGNAQPLLKSQEHGVLDFDLVLDATADASVASLLERCRAERRDDWPHVLSVLVGHDARRGIVALSRPGATGAGRDILRRLTLTARRPYQQRLADFANDFFPREGRTAPFQPEPGCSWPTFVGSAAELAALAGHMFDAGLAEIARPSGDAADPMVAGVVRLNSADGGRLLPGLESFGWLNDEVLHDRTDGYEVRISHSALSHMRAECRRGLRLRGRNVETGGTIFGRIDDACRCIWIDDASGPPPDSRLSAVHFDHGVEGLRELIDYQRASSGLETTYLGMWHSHPDGAAAPSPTDSASMHDLVSEVVGGPPRALIVILGGDRPRWDRWLAGDDIPEIFAEVIHRRKLGPKPSRPPTPGSHESSFWPGGWAPTQRDASRRRRRSWLSRLFSR